MFLPRCNINTTRRNQLVTLAPSISMRKHLTACDSIIVAGRNRPVKASGPTWHYCVCVGEIDSY